MKAKISKSFENKDGKFKEGGNMAKIIKFNNKNINYKKLKRRQQINLMCELLYMLEGDIDIVVSADKNKGLVTEGDMKDVDNLVLSTNVDKNGSINPRNSVYVDLSELV